MKRNKYLLITIVIAGICLAAAAAVSMAIGDRPDRGDRSGHYDTVDAYVNVPEYKTDAARAIDAYERLMERYMDLSEQLVSQMGGGYQSVTMKLDSIDAKMNELSARLARIEKKLGIDPNSDITGKPLKSGVAK